MTLFMMSYFPICAADFTTTRLTPGVVKASMISRWYGALSVRQRPGSAEPFERMRYVSAHSTTDVFGSGLKPRIDVYRLSSFAVFIVRRALNLFLHEDLRRILGQLLEFFLDFPGHDGINLLFFLALKLRCQLGRQAEELRAQI